MADAIAAGRAFLDALTRYIRWRQHEDGAEPAEHVHRYGEYLAALGVGPESPLHDSLMEHMRQMKSAGRVPKVPAKKKEKE